MRAKRILLIISTLLAVGLIAQVASASKWDRQPMLRPESGLSGFGPVEEIYGAHARLHRTDDGIVSQVRSSAEPGTALTKWFVVFNAPEECLAECGLGDILVLDENGAPVMDGENPVINVEQIQRARISIVYGEVGTVANPGGRFQMDGQLAVDSPPTGTAQVVAGREEDNPVMAVSPVTGVEAPHTAEVHIVLQSHGQAHDDPELLEQQLTQFFGACNPDCPDDQFSVHK